MVAYFVYVLYMCVVIPFKNHSFEIMIVSIAYWVATTVSSLPGFKMYLLWIFIFFMIRYPISHKKSSIIFKASKPKDANLTMNTVNSI